MWGATMTRTTPRVLWPPRDEPEPEQQHPADAALKIPLAAMELILQTQRVPGLMRNVTEFGRVAYAKGREDALKEIES
jgi:hypothetical protein